MVSHPGTWRQPPPCAGAAAWVRSVRIANSGGRIVLWAAAAMLAALVGISEGQPTELA
jgi:hypothetical protein